MVYRKLAADHLFTGNIMLSDEWVLVCDENGVVADIIHEQEAGEGIKRYSGILSPGFINCHCHLELSHMKNRIGEGTGMVEFLLGVMNNRVAAPEEIAEAIGRGEKEMIENGIVAVGDICNTAFTLPVKSEFSLHYHSFIEVAGFIESMAQMRFSACLELYKQFIRAELSASIVPHAPYSVSPALFKLINDFDPTSILTIHNQESEAEDLFFKNGEGDLRKLFKQLGVNIDPFQGRNSGSLPAYLHYFSSTHPVIFVHNVFTTQEDIQRAENHLSEIYWCVCPNANWYINRTVPPIEKLMRSGAKMVIGTDSLASNHELNIWSEINTLRKHFPSIAIHELLKWATINGAEALRLNDELGSFEKGKKPGVINIVKENVTRIL